VQIPFGICRVTSVFGEAEYLDKETALWRFSSIAQTEGLSLTGWAVFAFPCSFQRKSEGFVAVASPLSGDAFCLSKLLEAICLM